jgi:tetratricopeptide (TPR) repeat protein
VIARLHVLLLCVGLVLAPLPITAQSQDDLSEAQQQQLVKLIESGKTAYDRGEFEQSLGEFRKAYDLYQHPDIIYRIALCHERLGEDREAVRYYRQFLAAAPNAPDRLKIEKTIEVIEKRIGRSSIKVTTEPAGASVYIDDEANGVAGTTPTDLALEPGNYKLIVRRKGYEDVSELVTVNAGQTLQVRYKMTMGGAAATMKDKPRKGAPPSVKLLTLASIGIAAGITSGVFFGLHNDRRKKIEELDMLERQDIPRQRYEQLEKQKTTNLAIAVSAAAVSAFALIWAYGTWVGDRNARRKAASAGLTVGWDDGPMVGYGFRF